jgi:hypothetical protein
MGKAESKSESFPNMMLQEFWSYLLRNYASAAAGEPPYLGI